MGVGGVSEVIVLGAGPAGLGATLALARAGVAVTLVEGAPWVGGLCITRRQDGLGYDIGGHIPFVRDRARLDWLRELLDERLRWVPKPVRSVRDGRLRAGRYLDQPAQGPPASVDDVSSARDELERRVGTRTVEAEMRAYLEKIDGVPLEWIPADRARRLSDDQAAPDGFHFPMGGIGELMDAMADAARAAGAEILTGTRIDRVHAHGGRVSRVDITNAEGRQQLETERVIAALPAPHAVRLIRPHPPAQAMMPVRMRAVRIAYLEAAPRQPFDDAWVQVDDPEIPFARLFAPGNWSDELVSGDRTLFGCECYCQAGDDDPLWNRDDLALIDDCARALRDRLGWIDSDARVRPVDMVRLAGAYPLPDLRQAGAVQAAVRWLGELEGLEHAPGAAVIEAIENGERAAGRLFDGRL